LQGLFENILFISGVSSWFCAQFLKVFIGLLKNGRQRRFHGYKDLLATAVWRTGGMPSSHASLVSSMATSVGFKYGFHSDFFIIVFFIALIIMRDALGVRRSSGLQARMLNQMGRIMADELAYDFHPLKEVHGHTPMEVLIGALLGVFIAAALALL
jgi:acid phosphatase family membrane protein YuiD